MKEACLLFLVIYLCYETPIRADESISQTKNKYEFETIVVHSIGTTKQEFPSYDEHFLVKVGEEEQMKLCMEAKKHAALDGPVPDHNGKLFYVDKYSITDMDKNSNVDVAIRCETIPRSHLTIVNYRNLPEPEGKDITAPTSSDSDYSDDLVIKSVNEMITGSSTGAYHSKETAENTVKWISILLGKNRFTKNPYTFSVDKIKLIPEADKKADPEEWPAELLLYSMYDHDRVDVCVAAKKHVKEVVPEMKKSVIEKPKIFRFRYGSEDVRTLMAIECCSIPPMYVHFKERTRHNRPVLVIWVDPKGKTEDQEEEKTTEMESLVIEKTEPETQTIALDAIQHKQNGTERTEPPENGSASQESKVTDEPALKGNGKTASESPKKTDQTDDILEK